MKKKAIIYFLLFSILLFSACKNKEKQYGQIITLNISKQDVIKFETRPWEIPGIEGGETTDIDEINKIIDKLNCLKFRVAKPINKDVPTTYGQLVLPFEFTYKSGVVQKYVDRRSDWILPDGTRIEPMDVKFDFREYLIEYFDFELALNQPKKLKIPKKEVLKLEILSSKPQISPNMETTDLNLINEIIAQLNQIDFCVHPSGDDYFKFKSGLRYTIVFTYNDGSKVQYELLGIFFRRSDGTWLQQIDRSFDIEQYFVEKIGGG